MEVTNEKDKGFLNSIADLISSPTEFPKAPSFEESQQNLDSATIRQIDSLTESSNALATADVARQVAQDNIEYETNRLGVLNEMQETLASRKEILAVPELLRDVASLVYAPAGKDYYDEKLQTQMMELQALEQGQAVKHQVATQRAYQAAGYNPLAEPILDKARLLSKGLSDRKAAEAEMKHKQQQLAFDKIKLNEEIADKRSQRQLDWRKQIFEEEKAANEFATKDRQYELDLRKQQFEEEKSANEFLTKDRQFAFDQYKFQVEQGLGEYAGKSNSGIKAQAERLKNQQTIADYEAQAYEAEARAQQNAQQSKLMKLMNNGSLYNSEINLGTLMLDNSAMEPDPIKKTAMQKQANSAYDKGVSSAIARLPNEASKKVVYSRLNSGGVLTQKDSQVASDAFYANFRFKSATPSIEGKWFDAIKPDVEAAIISKYEELNPSDKKQLNSLLGGGEGNLLEALFAVSPTVPMAELKKLIPTDEILNQVLNKKNSKGYSYRAIYNMELANNYNEFYLDRLAEFYSDQGDTANFIRNSKLNKSLNIGQKLGQIANYLTAKGLASDVPNMLQEFRSPTNVQDWYNQYRNRAISYDTESAIMMPLLGFDYAQTSVLSALNNPNVTKALDAILAESSKLQANKAAAQNILTNGGANAPIK